MVRKVTQSELDQRRQVAREAQERKEQLKDEIKKSPPPNSVAGISERVAMLEELLGFR